MPEYTPTERKIMELLGDGLAHRPQEIHRCLPDELGPLSNIAPILSYLRKKLRPIGQDILACREGETHYRLVRYLTPYSE